jgi:hypothetical protein
MTVFCYVAPCSLEEVDRRFRGAYRLYREEIPGIHERQRQVNTP